VKNVKKENANIDNGKKEVISGKLAGQKSKRSLLTLYAKEEVVKGHEKNERSSPMRLILGEK
jgi:hypothetical protein